MTPSTDSFLTREAVCQMTGLSRVTLWRMERAGTFPRSIPIGARRVAYARSELDGWIEERKATRLH